jgi:hypothetical protein
LRDDASGKQQMSERAEIYVRDFYGKNHLNMKDKSLGAWSSTCHLCAKANPS